MLHRFGQVGERFHFPAVHLSHGKISDVIVTNRRVRRQHLRENDDALFSVRIKLRLETVLVDQALGRVLHPIGAPFPKILPGKLLEDQPAENVVERCAIKIVRRDNVIVRVTMLEPQLELHRFSAPLDVDRQSVPRKCLCRDQVRKLNLAVERIYVVPVLVDLVVAHPHHDVAHL